MYVCMYVCMYVINTIRGAFANQSNDCTILDLLHSTYSFATYMQLTLINVLVSHCAKGAEKRNSNHETVRRRHV